MIKRFTFGDILRDVQKRAKGPQWNAFEAALRDSAEKKLGGMFIDCSRYNISVAEAYEWAKHVKVLCKLVDGETSLLLITWDIQNDLGSETS